MTQTQAENEPRTAPESAGERSRLRRVRDSRWVKVAVVLAVAVLGAWLGLIVGGHETRAIGPVETRLSFEPSLTGDSILGVPPLGSLSLDTHDGPLRLRADVVRLNAADTRAIFNDPSQLRSLPEQVSEDIRAGVLRLALRSLAAAAIGAFVVGMILWRRWRRSLVASGVAIGLVLASGAAAAATWNPRAVNEPRYSGLLASAPALVGSAEQIVGRFDIYSQQLAKIVTNVSRLYDVGSRLPVFAPDDSSLRVLHVSDIHLNPAAWDVIRSVTEQFQVDLIIDTGDLSDHGTGLEASFADGIATLGVPYVFIGGNHDSAVTIAAVARQPNAIVVHGQQVTVDGLRIIGDRDPRFTPDKDTRTGDSPADSVLDLGLRLANSAQMLQPPPNVALVHDPESAQALDGSVPLVLAGHTHKRDTYLLPNGTRVFVQGSTGGAGLRGLEHEDPTPIQCSVLYMSKNEGTLVAWDDITLGGLGLASAQVERHLPGEIANPESQSESEDRPVPSSGSPTP